MKLTRFVGAVVLALAGAVAVHASDMIGVYGRVDKVVMEPNDQAPQRIQVWGVFAMASPENGNDYLPPARGYLYYTLPSNAQLALKEWADLKAVAGTGQIVAFGTRYNTTRRRVRLRNADEPPDSPDAYAMDIGLRKITGRTDYAPVRAITDFKP
jgi:hypothetical protein